MAGKEVKIKSAMPNVLLLFILFMLTHIFLILLCTKYVNANVMKIEINIVILCEENISLEAPYLCIS